MHHRKRSLVNRFRAMCIVVLLTETLYMIDMQDVVETTLALDNFRRACDSGRGAVFFSVARGKVRRCPATSSLGDPAELEVYA